MGRFTRLTNGFSKKIENHAAMVAVHAVHYNFARIVMIANGYNAAGESAALTKRKHYNPH
jgi:hypothetical protein